MWHTSCLYKTNVVRVYFIKKGKNKRKKEIKNEYLLKKIIFVVFRYGHGL